MDLYGTPEDLKERPIALLRSQEELRDQWISKDGTKRFAQINTLNEKNIEKLSKSMESILIYFESLGYKDSDCTFNWVIGFYAKRSETPEEYKEAISLKRAEDERIRIEKENYEKLVKERDERTKLLTLWEAYGDPSTWSDDVYTKIKKVKKTND